jgi:hypothetical protein
MDTTEIQNLLTTRARLQMAIAEKQKNLASLRKLVEAKIPQEIKDELDSLNVEFSTEGESKTLVELEDLIKLGVLTVGASVKAEGAGQAIFNKGRVTWNGAGLDGLMVAVPQLEQFRKVGDPYVSFR